MTTTRRFTADDMLKFNNVNLDYYTETYNIPFYFEYLATWPEYFYTVETPHDGTVMGYVMGKVEGDKPRKKWHGHVTALTVAPEFRRLGLARKMMDLLEEITEKIHKAYFVDLFVRVSNKIAVGMYEKLGYTTYRRVLQYYSGKHAEDGFDMRKSTALDPEKKAMIPLGRDIHPEELDATL
ncbi:N-acetyltransferase 5 [Naegleria gruberi]|uniref:N-acetyltransferase 5 n=1 Tax=Naegleria gruberi TaxID=5762 RepID=D2UX91_NAEGR|nr:N-acetyltransferase 5 [Naegleria gruberi]EFC50590.1 N-acetyltransferase 5 [Naegleria gruberi]|eukprot:XP_002683334.1 N-acetyltransferase 5 [Naegleria gruberi strain NEG-M]